MKDSSIKKSFRKQPLKSSPTKLSKNCGKGKLFTPFAFLGSLKIQFILPEYAGFPLFTYGTIGG
jgi:hypothetical protein